MGREWRGGGQASVSLVALGENQSSGEKVHYRRVQKRDKRQTESRMAKRKKRTGIVSGGGVVSLQGAGLQTLLGPRPFVICDREVNLCIRELGFETNNAGQITNSVRQRNSSKIY